MLAEYNPFSMIVNKGILKLFSMDRNYLNFTKLKNHNTFGL